MSKMDLNVFAKGIAGKVGTAVVRRVGEHTILAALPRKTNKAPSEKTLQRRDRFKRASAYARAKMEDPIMKAEYEAMAAGKDFMHAFNAAMRDYLQLPRIVAVVADGYTGNVGDKIIIKPMDYQKLKTLTVTITRADNTIVETGNATVALGELDWTYTATVANAQLAGCRITVNGIDRPGNEVVMAVQL